MQYINQVILQILSRIEDLLPLERRMREDRDVVVPGSGNGKGFKRTVKRPWKPLPSIWKFEIHLAVHDWLLLLFGLFKRYNSATTLYGWYNGKANLYVDYMFKRLRYQVKNELYEAASETMWILMNSHAYQVCCLNYIIKGWYKTTDFNKVLANLKTVKKLARSRSTKISYKRVYLEEPTKWRPLGVPSPAWRIYLHMYNNLITEWRLITEDGSQHAYLPGKGVITAWEALFERLHSEPNIYEADFKGFFNNVTHEGIDYVLWQLGFPQPERDFMRELNRSIPKLTTSDKVYEPDRNYPFLSTGEFNPEAGMQFFPSLVIRDSISPNTVKDLPNPYEEPVVIPPKPPVKRKSPLISLDDLLAEIDNPVIEEKVPEYPQGPLIRYNGVLYEPDELISIRAKPLDADLLGIPIILANVKDKGVPQGAPTSCSLATLAIRKLLQLGHKLLVYADDVIYFPRNPHADHAEALSNEQFGLSVQESKSRMAKINGEWIVESIKFLGFRYYPESYIDTIWESMGYPFFLILSMDLLLIGFPFLSVLFFVIAWRQRHERHRARFCAATRNGATLEFTDKEALIMYLNNARTLLLNASVKQELGGPKLAKFIVMNYARFILLSNPISLLFEKLTHRKFGIGMLVNKKTGRAVMSGEAFNALPTESKIALKMFGFHIKEWLVPHIPLTGYMMSRMQSDEWNIKHKQDFKLKPSKGSWIDRYWQLYRRQNNLSSRVLTTFTASSFACHHLLNWQFKKVKGSARYILTARKSRSKRSSKNVK